MYLNVIENTPIETIINTQICNGDSILFGNDYYTNSGQYQLHYTSLEGCDSLVVLNLTQSSKIEQTINTSICFGDSVFFNNTYLKDSGQYIAHFISIQGCDSVVTFILNTYPQYPTTEIHATICSGNSYAYHGVNYAQSGSYNVILSTVHQCDSVVVLYLQVDSPLHVFRKLDSCFQASVNGSLYTHDTISLYSIPSSVTGCDSLIITDTINIFSPAIAIASSEAFPLIVGEQSTLSISPAGSYANIHWSPNQNISNIDSISPIVSPISTIQYVVTLTDSNQCILSDSILIPVAQTLFAMPTAFTPNGDGNNDIFFPVLSSDAVHIDEFRIYNRFGQIIYEMNESAPKGWDGTYKGELQPLDTYTYFLKITYKNQKAIWKSNNFALIH
jgi:gliding motility-associated-like protein